MIAIFTASGSASAQDPLTRVREAIQARDLGAAETALAAVLRSGDGGESRHRTLSEGLLLLRDAGATEGALRALDAAVSARPSDPMLLYHRGLLRRELKLLAGAREDLKRALAADPGADPLEGELAVTEAFDFNHGEAARLLRNANLKDAAASESRLERSHASAKARQWVALLFGVAVLFAPWAAFRRRR